MPHAHAHQFLRIGLAAGGDFGLLPEPFRAGKRLETQVRRVFSKKTAQVEALGRVVHQFQVLPNDVLCPLAVIPPQEFLSQRPVVLPRVPEQLRQHPRLQLGHLRPGPGVGAFLEDPLHVVRLKQPEVQPQHKPVRMRQYVVGEVRHIVPNVKPPANLRPALEVGQERGIGGMVQRLPEVALDRA